MIETVSFKSNGVKCVADLYLPDGSRGAKRPAVVMGQGFNGVREGLVQQAEILRKAGFVAIAIDYASFGESEGEPRGELFPLNQVEDFRNGITYLEGRGEVDAEKIGIWGASFAGGTVIQAAAFDRRVKAVVSQSPIVNGRKWMRAMRKGSEWEDMLSRLENDRRLRYQTGDGLRIPSSGQASGDGLGAIPSDAILPGIAEKNKALSTYRADITLESVEKVIEFCPEFVIDLISPRALCIVANGGYDVIHPLEQITEAFSRAREPKKLVILPYKSIGFYSEPGLSESMGHAVTWFTENLHP